VTADWRIVDARDERRVFNIRAIHDPDGKRAWLDMLVEQLDMLVEQNGATWGGGVFDPATAVAKYGQPAFIFDFSKTDRTFQTSGAGQVTATTPADDAGEAIALALEESQWGGKTFAAIMHDQAEIVVSGDGSSTAGWSPGAGATLSSVGGRLRIVTSEPGSGASQIVASTINSFYVAKWKGFYSTSDFVVTLGLAFAQGQELDSGLKSADSDQSFIVRASRINEVLTLFSHIAGTVEWDDISYKKIPGDHAAQSAHTSFRPTRQANGWVRPDGTDDYLEVPHFPGSARFYLMRIHRSANAASRVLMGSTNTNRAFMGVNGSNNLTLGLGGTTQDTGLAVPLGDIVVAVGWDGATKKAWVGNAAPYAAAQGADVPNTTTAIDLFANNNAGVRENFSPFDTRFAMGLPALPTDAEVASLISYVGGLTA